MGEDGIKKDLDEIKISVARVCGQLESQNAEVKRVNREVFGNGRQGLREELSAIRARLGMATWVLTVTGGAALVYIVTTVLDKLK